MKSYKYRGNITTFLYLIPNVSVEALGGLWPMKNQKTISYRATRLPQVGGATYRDVSQPKQPFARLSHYSRVLAYSSLKHSHFWESVLV